MAPKRKVWGLVCLLAATPLKRQLLCAGFLVFVFAVNPASLYSQSATSGLITGVVTDPSNAVVQGATVALQQRGTDLGQTTVTDTAGRYSFPAVDPGDYTLKVAAAGFSTTSTVLHVEVGKSLTVNVGLKMGQATQTVEVTASQTTELQTTDSSIGNVLSGEGVGRLPAYTRSATSLMFLQPGVTPAPIMAAGMSQNDNTSGQVTGSRSEQITFSLDGGDATSDLEGSDNYASPPGEPQPAPVIPTPMESTEEFRVATSNPNSTVGGHSSGGQVALLTKHGTNSFHGSAYEYHFDDGLGANTWQNNFADVAKAHQVDNRFGFTVGGPVWKNRVFFFGNYEGRRLYDSSQFTAIVPTPTLQQGILQFKDAAGNIVQYNFNPANPLSSQCGASGTGACDPRGKGFSPAIQAQLALYKPGNFAGLGDGLNTTGYAFNLATPTLEDLGVARLDYRIDNKWSLFGTYHLSNVTRVGTEQIDILTPQSVSGDPINASFYTFELTGQLSPQLTMVTHGSYLKNWWGWSRATPTPLVTGANATVETLELAGEGVGNTPSTAKLIEDPINVNTQQARGRTWDGHDWYIAQDYSWQHGRHLFQFGAAGYIWNDYHVRTDDVLGGLTNAPIDYVEASGNGSGQWVGINGTYEPQPCTATVTSNCLPGNNALRWNELYAAVLGLVDRSAQIETRNGQFQPNSLGTPLFDKVHIPAFTTYVQDVWQVRPSLTATLGLDWGVQLTPSEAQGKEVAWTYADTNTPINYKEYIDSRKTQLEQGNSFNPTFGLAPVDSLPSPYTGKIRQTTWHDVGPRVSMAWQVPFHNWLFGNNETVIRGGYALLWDRSSAVGEVLNPLLTGGLADVDQCGGPVFSGSGAVCTNAPTTPANAFRIGVDGNTVPVPAPQAQSIPFVPASFLGLTISSALDPFTTPAHSHSIDFTIQRALPGKMFLEIGYIGRFSRNLPEGLALGAPDYMMKDKASNQTLAQAFDGVAQQVRAGADPTTITEQPFFKNQFGGTANCQAQSAALVGTPNLNCSGLLAAADPTDLFNGALSFTMLTFDQLAPSLGQRPIDNDQVFEFSATTSGGFSNYNAGFLALNKSFANGLQFQFNWTWSHAIGIQGINQQYIISVNSPFNPALDKSSESFDRKHTVNTWWYYKLPFGQSARYRTGSNVIDRAIGGWYTSGIFTFATGQPVCILGDGDYGSFLNTVGTCAIPSSTLPKPGLYGLGTVTNGQPNLPNVFADPTAVQATLSHALLSVNNSIPFDQMRFLNLWNFDLSLGKNIVATERFKMVFSADFLNAFNHPALFTGYLENGNYSLDIGSPSTFGQISSQDNQPRRILLGMRFDF